MSGDNPAKEGVQDAPLSRLRPFVPRALLDGAWWDALVDRADGLPWAPILGFEFRLTDARPAADFGFFVATNQAHDYYIARGRDAESASPAAALGRFLARLDRSSPTADPALADAFERMTIEYDIAEVPFGARPAPGVFVWLNPEFVAGPDKSGRVVDVIASAVGWDDYRDVARAVAQVWDAMPEGLEWGHQIAAQPGREPQAVRLVTQRVEAEVVPGMMEALGWPGSIAQVEEVLAGLRGLSLTFRPSLDVFTGGLSPRLGLLLIMPTDREHIGRWLTTGREDWREIVERMTAQGWCRPEKAQGLLEWPGREQLFTEQGLATCYKGINHLKLVITGDHVEAKAYCGLLYKLLNSST